MSLVRPCLAVSVAALALGQQAAAQRGGQLPPVLVRAIEAQRTIRLQGPRKVSVTEAGETRSHEERVLRDGARMRIEFPQGGPLAGNIIVENDIERHHFIPSQNVIKVLPPREAFDFLRVISSARLRKPLTWSAADGGTVAGRPTRQVTAMWRGQRKVFQAWIDSERFAILKAESFAISSKKLASFEYLRVAYNPQITDGSFSINKPGARLETPEDDLAKAARNLGLPAYKVSRSSGYRLMGVRPLNKEAVKVLMQTYGFAGDTVSLFIVKGNVNAERLKNLAGTGLNSHIWERNGVRLVLVGEQDESELRQLAGSVGL